MSIRRATELYGVPKSTLADYLKMTSSNPTTPIQLKSMGPETTLSKETEQQMVQMIVSLAEIGFPIGREEFLDIVAGFLKHTKHLP
jgi:hypothetical protein